MEAQAEAAERTRRLAFDPGAEADKVRRYEDASIRRMTRACEDLAKLRRSGMLDKDAYGDADLSEEAQGWELAPSREFPGDAADAGRCEQPVSGGDDESGAETAETDCDALAPPDG